MAFDIELLERDEHYLLTCSDLSANTRGRIVPMLAQHLGNLSTAYVDDPANRIAPDSSYVWHHLMLLSDGQIVMVRSIVDVSTAEHGVLRVMFVDTVVGQRMVPLN